MDGGGQSSGSLRATPGSLVGKAGSLDFWLQSPWHPGAGVDPLVSEASYCHSWLWGPMCPKTCISLLGGRTGSQDCWLRGPKCWPAGKWGWGSGSPGWCQPAGGWSRSCHRRLWSCGCLGDGIQPLVGVANAQGVLELVHAHWYVS